MIHYKLLPIEHLCRGKYQPREQFDEDSLNELAQSILTQGLIEPLIVRQVSNDRYEIIAGERRWRASMIAQMAEVPCLVGDYSNEQAAAVTIIENIQREDLNLIEEATGYQRLITEFGFTQDDIATLVGKSRSHIANILRLLTLNSVVQERIRLRQLSLGHARMLVGLTNQQQNTLVNQVHDNGWSVRQLEKEVKALKSSSNRYETTGLAADTIYLENRLAEQIGAPVKLTPDDNAGGWLKIKYFDNDTLTGLLERMGLSYD